MLIRRYVCKQWQACDHVLKHKSIHACMFYDVHVYMYVSISQMSGATYVSGMWRIRVVKVTLACRACSWVLVQLTGNSAYECPAYRGTHVYSKTEKLRKGAEVQITVVTRMHKCTLPFPHITTRSNPVMYSWENMHWWLYVVSEVFSAEISLRTVTPKIIYFYY